MAEQTKISVYSLPDLKNTTDDTLPNYLNSLKFTQSHFYTDVRLALGYAAVVIAGALFYFDWKLGWDVTRAWTLPAVVAYFILNGAFTYWLLWVEKGTIYVGEKNGVKLVISSSSDKTNPIYKLSVKYTTSKSSQWKTLEVSAPFNKWFSSDGYFVPKPFQQWLASSVPVVGEADPKNAVEEVPTAPPTKSPTGSTTQPLNVNIENLPDVLNALKAQGGKTRRRG